jgi:predicted acetyltransferase
LLVLELVALDPVVEQALWQWLFAMDLVGVVKGRRGPVPHPLQSWLVEPRRLALVTMDALWLRLLDVPAALMARSYAGDGSIVFEVDDETIPANAGRWQITVPAQGGGAATVTRTTSDPDLALDVAALASAYLGAFRFGDLASAGRVRECRPNALQRADALFTPPRAPWCSTIF